MLISIEDFVNLRANQGINWPTREDIYQMRYHNHCGFADSKAIRLLGEKKLLIDPILFDEWLEKASFVVAHQDKVKKIYNKKKKLDKQKGSLNVSENRTKDRQFGQDTSDHH